MNDHGYTVYFEDHTHHYDEVTVNEGGWLCCFLRTPGEPTRSFKFPPHRVEMVEMEVRE